MSNVSKSQEIGWNYLDTRFTGVSSSSLSGNGHFVILPEDQGTATTQSALELKRVV